ncbi:chemotaxis protein CheB [Limnohabitans sp.]|uniref:chemotaxis protein CheB n=1 Tax=Limnohabitans sp. TaxID=1907725 RepID=UPI0025BF51ED|nr:chemotaxis protein CheB [Limnohabitans sp.]
MPVHEGPRMVGIGASAGGLEALEQFFAHVPTDSGLAYVVVQHTSPGHKTLLGNLLQRVTSLPVRDAHNGVVLAPDHIYVMPTGGLLRVERGCLRFKPARKSSSSPQAIDVFLTSLAQDQGARAAGVVLSGMGHDGTAGLQALHSAAGLCLAQQPDTAAFAAMPQSAIDAGCVDAVAPPQELPGLIAQWLGRSQPVAIDTEPSPMPPHWPEPNAAAGPPQATAANTPGAPAVAFTEVLQSIVDLLHQHLQHDFSLYKPSTLLRRVERRMHVHQLSSMADYLLYLQRNPQELDVLFSEMLIGVTAFFRDPQVWQDLATQVLPPLLAAQRSGPVRAWVLGCSTGEEAYSLAMLLRETQDPQALVPMAAQIYATDLNPTAIAVARKGWYSAQALADVSEARRERFFTPHEGGFTVHPDIRAMVMFARHDVIVDPPFTQLDVLLCRNVLIYFNATLQRRLMPLFHFSLRAGGTLVLGSAETVGRSQNLFSTLVPRSRIYRRNEQTFVHGSVVFPVHRRVPTPLQELSVTSPASPTSSATSAIPNLQTLADQVLLQAFSPAAVLVNAAGDIVYISGRTGQYLEPAAGKANWNLHVMLRPALRTPIAVALRQALQERQSVVLKGLPLSTDRPDQLQVTVHPLQEPQALAGMAMVVFKEQAAIGPLSGSAPPGDAVIHAELQNAQQEMQSLRQEMQASKDQMFTLNESMKLSNEELQSANEELTTSKEEAQSMNEELQTINSELQTRLDDLALAQSDMQNLLNSTDIATLFLDNELNVRRYTEQAVPIFHLRESDVGRPLSDLANTLDYPLLLDDVKETLRSLTPCTKSVSSTDGRWFSVRIMPYRTLANMVNGAVLTFVDISIAKALEFRLREAN